MALLSGGVTGCASQELAPADTAVWELASAKPVDIQAVGHGRINYDRPLPAHLTQMLSDQFTLVTVRRKDDLDYLWRRLQILEDAPVLDFSSGLLVGILADVGEFAQSSWPIQIESVHGNNGLGLVQAKLLPGVYYPVRTAGYVQLIYVRGIKTIRMVQINQATYTLRSPAPAN